MSKLGDYTNIKTGKLDANASNENGQYPFFTCSKEPLKIDNYTYDCECVLVAGNGDLNVKYYNGKFDAYQRTYIIESKNKNELYVPYLYLFLDNYLITLREQSIGGVIKYIKLGNLTKAEIPLPPIEKQKKISDELDKINTIIEKRKAQIEKLDLLVKAKFVEMFGDPVENPMGWEVSQLTDLGELNRGVSKHRPRNDPKLLNGVYPLIQTGEVANSALYINTYKSTYSDLGLKQSKLWSKGTLCITIAANIAKTSILNFDACFPDSVVGFVSNEQSDKIFIHYWFSFFQKILEAQAPESAQKNINLQILRSLNVISPPIKKQNQFASYVQKVESTKQTLETSLTHLETLYKQRMQHYFE